MTRVRAVWRNGGAYWVAVVVLCFAVAAIAVWVLWLHQRAGAAEDRAEQLESLVAVLSERPSEPLPIRWSFDVGGQVLECERVNLPDRDPLYRCSWEDDQ